MMMIIINNNRIIVIMVIFIPHSVWITYYRQVKTCMFNLLTTLKRVMRDIKEIVCRQWHAIVAFTVTCFRFTTKLSTCEPET